MTKATNEQIKEAYERLHSVWKVAAEFDMCGQSVWERLKKMGYEDPDKWTDTQLEILRQAYSVAINEPINIDALARVIGKSKSNVSRKARDLGFTTSRMRRKPMEAIEKLSVRSRLQIQKNGHPRGYRELRTCPMCGKFFDVPHSSRQVYCSTDCVYKVPRSEERFTNRKGGRREDLNNIYFRSAWEANYARYLNFLMANGEPIDKWEFEADTFEFVKIKRGTRLYTPDFKLTLKGGHIEYHEVKGWDYPKGRTARKRFAKYFPHLKLVLIDEEFFKATKKQGIDRLIPGWE